MTPCHEGSFERVPEQVRAHGLSPGGGWLYVLIFSFTFADGKHSLEEGFLCGEVDLCDD